MSTTAPERVSFWSLDYLNLTFKLSTYSIEDVAVYWSAITGDYKLHDLGRRLPFYMASYDVGGGAVLWTAGIADAAGTHMLTLPGEALRNLNVSQLRLLIRMCVIKDVSITRCDPALDVFKPFFTPTVLFDYASDGWIKSRCRTTEKNGRVNKPFELVKGKTGDTFYFGSRQSDKYLRVYDAYAAGHYETPGMYRYELELKKSVAKSFIYWMNAFDSQFPDDDDEFLKACHGLMTSAVNSHMEVMSGVASRVTNDIPHKEWSVIFSGKVSLRPPVVEKNKTLKEIEQWLINQCSGALALMQGMYGDISQLIKSMLDHGNKQLEKNNKGRNRLRSALEYRERVEKTKTPDSNTGVFEQAAGVVRAVLASVNSRAGLYVSTRALQRRSAVLRSRIVRSENELSDITAAIRDASAVAARGSAPLFAGAKSRKVAFDQLVLVPAPVPALPVLSAWGWSKRSMR